MIDQVVVFAVAVTAFGIVGVGIGMLVAPRLGRLAERLTEPTDEDAGDGPD